MPEDGRIAIKFDDGSALLIRRTPDSLAVDFVSDTRSSECPVAVQPSSRQREYLAFIEKYMTRFGRSPAESDIQRHFLVSAPSVNHMMQTLERLGFITRQQGVGRSIRLVDAKACWLCGSTHHLKAAK